MRVADGPPYPGAGNALRTRGVDGSNNDWKAGAYDADGIASLGDGPHFTSPSDPAGIKIGGSFPQNTAEANPCNCGMDYLVFLDRVATPDEIAAQYAGFTAR